MTLLELLLLSTNVVGVLTITVLSKELRVAQDRYKKAEARLMKALPKLNKNLKKEV